MQFRFDLFRVLLTAIILLGTRNTIVGQIPLGKIPAFPSAQGYGAFAIGGRGGQVIEVTNLDDSGPGSLRAAVTATGPRIVVFRVGGTIELKSDIIVQGEAHSYLTIAGQTAPGGGILLKKYTMQFIDIHDIIVRHIRIRTGFWGAEGARHGILVWGWNSPAHDVIFDHVSVSWITDDNAIWGNVSNVTLQWTLFAEGSRQGRDQYDCSGCGLLWGPTDEVNHLSVHHNLLIHNYYRNPAMGGGEHQFINNVIYDPGYSATIMAYGNSEPYVIDIIGNYYKKGLDTRPESKEVSFEGSASAVSLFLQDNFGWNYVPNDPWSIVASNSYTKRSTPLGSQPTLPIATQGFEEAKNLVISNVGATLPQRDAVDERLINEFKTGTGHLDKGSDWPFIANGTPPADSDHDGMPDEWENAHRLNPQNAADGNHDANGDGYLNIEEYLNELAGDMQSSPALMANLNADKISGQAPLTVQFNGSASGGKTPYGFKWDFGDGNTANVQNPTHTYQQANSYTVKLTVTDSENKQASASRQITVTARTQDEPSVADVKFTEGDRTEALSVIAPGKWFDLYLYVDDPQGWGNLLYADIWLSHASSTEGTVADRGGRHFAQSHYVMSYSLMSNTIWAKETAGTATWTEVSGKLGLYVDDDNNEYEQNNNEKWAKARIKLLPNATLGNWIAKAYVLDKETHISNLFEKNFRVIAADVPTASITLSDPSPTKAGHVQVTLTTPDVVTKLPTPLILTESDNSTTRIDLSGSVPGGTFTGTLVVDDTVADGLGHFSLAADALVDVNGNKGNEIKSGAYIRIDKTPPATPQNVKVSIGPP